jgi:hypothetical protein
METRGKGEEINVIEKVEEKSDRREELNRQR